MDMCNVSHYFSQNPYSESLLLAFSYNTKGQRITLVCDYAGDVIRFALQATEALLTADKKPYHRDVRQLVFEGVTEYLRDIGPSILAQRLEECKDSYQATESGPAITIDSININSRKSIDAFQVSLSFTNFGNCSFFFSHLYIDRKLIRSIGKDNKGKWQYIDIHNSKPVDFYHPFEMLI